MFIYHYSHSAYEVQKNKQSKVSYTRKTKFTEFLHTTYSIYLHQENTNWKTSRATMLLGVFFIVLMQSLAGFGCNQLRGYPQPFTGLSAISCGVYFDLTAIGYGVKRHHLRGSLFKTAISCGVWACADDKRHRLRGLGV